MISIDFKIDEEVLKEDLLEDEEKIVDSGLVNFVISFFIFPVKMRINEIELFEYKNNPWWYTPIMNIASEGLLDIKRLKQKKNVKYVIINGPGEFEFTMLDKDNVEVVFHGIEKIETVAKYSELLEAFQNFANKVREFIWERVPQMNDHPYWGPWLRGEKD